MADEQLAFLGGYPKGIYKMHFECTLIDGEITPFFKGSFKEQLDFISEHPEKRLIQTPKEFFQRWLNGRLGKTPNLSQYVGCNGFELQLPRVLIESSTIGFLEGLVIASDLGYTSDFGNDLVFAINDIPSQKVLVYQDKDGKNLKSIPLARKDLMPKRIYSFCEGQEEYPFKSFAPLKSADYTWSLVNVFPEEVYNSIREIGFSW